MGISLAKFNTKTKANAGVEVELLDAKTGLGAGVFITVNGTDSDAFRSAVSERSRAEQERLASGATTVLSPSELEVERSKLLAACTVGVRGLDNEDGTPFEFSKEAMQKIYTDYPMIREQIDKAVADRDAFILA